VISSPCAQVKNAEEKLRKLQEGAILVDPEEREKIQGVCVSRLAEWRKRKKAFKELWDMITETLPKDLKEFKVDYLNLIKSTLASCYVFDHLIWFRVSKNLRKGYVNHFFLSA
jgi:hypothetical protein